MRYQLIKPRDYSLNIVDQVLVNRGINPADVFHFKHPTDEDNLSPLLLENIKEGAQMLVKHIGQNDKIFLQVD